MFGLLDSEPTQPDPDAENRIPYFEVPAGEELPNESVTDGDR
jgi:hypothetical protein